MEEKFGTVKVKRGLAGMLKGGVIMGVTTVEQAQIAKIKNMSEENFLLRQKN